MTREEFEIEKAMKIAELKVAGVKEAEKMKNMGIEDFLVSTRIVAALIAEIKNVRSQIYVDTGKAQVVNEQKINVADLKSSIAAVNEHLQTGEKLQFFGNDEWRNSAVAISHVLKNIMHGTKYRVKPLVVEVEPVKFASKLHKNIELDVGFNAGSWSIYNLNNYFFDKKEDAERAIASINKVIGA